VLVVRFVLRLGSGHTRARALVVVEATSGGTQTHVAAERVATMLLTETLLHLALVDVYSKTGKY